MHISRALAGSIIYKDKIYIVGECRKLYLIDGFCGAGCLRSIGIENLEALPRPGDILIDRWDPVSLYYRPYECDMLPKSVV